MLKTLTTTLELVNATPSDYSVQKQPIRAGFFAQLISAKRSPKESPMKNYQVLLVSLSGKSTFTFQGTVFQS